MGQETLRIAILGLPCAGGDRLPLEKALSRVPGVLAAYMNPADESAYLTIDRARFKATEAVRTIEQFGCTALLEEVYPSRPGPRR